MTGKWFNSLLGSDLDPVMNADALADYLGINQESKAG
jgi:hypothetical protein